LGGVVGEELAQEQWAIANICIYIIYIHKCELRSSYIASLALRCSATRSYAAQCLHVSPSVVCVVSYPDPPHVSVIEGQGEVRALKGLATRLAFVYVADLQCRAANGTSFILHSVCTDLMNFVYLTFANPVEFKASIILIVGVIHYGNQSFPQLRYSSKRPQYRPLASVGIAWCTVPEGIQFPHTCCHFVGHWI